MTERGREVLEYFSRAQTMLVIGERKRKAYGIY